LFKETVSFESFETFVNLPVLTVFDSLLKHISLGRLLTQVLCQTLDCLRKKSFSVVLKSNLDQLSIPLLRCFVVEECSNNFETQLNH